MRQEFPAGRYPHRSYVMARFLFFFCHLLWQPPLKGIFRTIFQKRAAKRPTCPHQPSIPGSVLSTRLPLGALQVLGRKPQLGRAQGAEVALRGASKWARRLARLDWAVLRSPAESLTCSGLNGNYHQTRFHSFQASFFPNTGSVLWVFDGFLKGRNPWKQWGTYP